MKSSIEEEEQRIKDKDIENNKYLKGVLKVKNKSEENIKRIKMRVGYKFHIEITEAILKRMEEKNITFEMLAKMVGVAQIPLEDLFDTEFKMTLVEAAMICEVLDLKFEIRNK